MKRDVVAITLGGNHIKKILERFRDSDLTFDPKSNYHIEVLHDRQCGYWKSNPCDCDPIVSAITREQ